MTTLNEPRRLACACCGGFAGRWEQWPNQDAGYGVCADCVAWIIARQAMTPEEIQEAYGVEGVNYAPRPT